MPNQLEEVKKLFTEIRREVRVCVGRALQNSQRAQVVSKRVSEINEGIGQFEGPPSGENSVIAIWRSAVRAMTYRLFDIEIVVSEKAVGKGLSSSAFLTGLSRDATLGIKSVELLAVLARRQVFPAYPSIPWGTDYVGMKATVTRESGSTVALLAEFDCSLVGTDLTMSLTRYPRVTSPAGVDIGLKYRIEDQALTAIESGTFPKSLPLAVNTSALGSGSVYVVSVIVERGLRIYLSSSGQKPLRVSAAAPISVSEHCDLIVTFGISPIVEKVKAGLISMTQGLPEYQEMHLDLVETPTFNTANNSLDVSAALVYIKKWGTHPFEYEFHLTGTLVVRCRLYMQGTALIVNYDDRQLLNRSTWAFHRETGVGVDPDKIPIVRDEVNRQVNDQMNKPVSPLVNDVGYPACSPPKVMQDRVVLFLTE